MRFIKKAVLCVVLVMIIFFGMTFAAKNTQDVTLVYFDFLWEGKIVVALLIALLFGFLLGAAPTTAALFLCRRANRSGNKSSDLG